MAIAHHAMFWRFKEWINALPADVPEELLLAAPFLLEEDGARGLQVYYTPLEYVNPDAKLIIVGITPGLHQMKRAYSTVIEASGTDEDILRRVKREASFHGSMRKNLVAMLDELKLAALFEIETCGRLFNTHSHLLHSTSILPRAVFHKGRNYNGSTPKILANSMLQKYTEQYFPGNIEGIEETLMVPLGVNVQKVLESLMARGLIKRHRLLRGFPHPSGGNGHRSRQFAENKDRMMQEVKEFFYLNHEKG